MIFRHAPSVRDAFPDLSCRVLRVGGIRPDADATGPSRRFLDAARARLEDATEGELPEIQAWRRAFTRMGLKPTQYRCASEALLRRLRQEGSLPALHPAIDLCNAVSAAHAIPIAVFDVARIEGDLAVRPADGDETYLTFAGTVEYPAPGEIVFADAARRAHARRWTNRQSGHSAVRTETTEVLVVAEALHYGGAADVARLADALERGFGEVFPGCRVAAEENP